MRAAAPEADGRASVTVAHAKLSSPDDVALWKGDWPTGSEPWTRRGQRRRRRG